MPSLGLRFDSLLQRQNIGGMRRTRTCRIDRWQRLCDDSEFWRHYPFVCETLNNSDLVER